VILLVGPNGLGKTSIIQAVEWCLTGGLQYFSGGDFAREDALVNLFNRDKKSSVEIALVDDNNRKTVIRRSKKMGKSTGRGGSTVEVETHGKSYTSDEGESMIIESLFESIEEPAALFHLHQDSLRQILLADPKDRSRAIDKILGTFEVRDLVDAMDIERKLTLVQKKLEIEKQSLERDKVQIAVAAREKLSKQKRELEEQGWKDRLDLPCVMAELKSSIRQLETVGQELGHEFEVRSLDTERESDISKTQEFISKLRSETQKLDRSRIGSVSAIREKRISISSVLDQYNSAEKAIAQLGAQRIEDVDQQKKDLARELSSTAEELAQIEKMRKLLEEPAKTARRIDTRLRQLLEPLSELKSRIGDETAQTSTLRTLKFDLESLQVEVNRFSKERQLTTIALEFVQATRPKACPVCMQGIDVDEVIEKLRARSVDELSKQVEKSMAEFARKSEAYRKFESDVRSFKQLSSESSESDSAIQRLLVQVESIMHQRPKSTDDLADLLETLDRKAFTLSRDKAKLEGGIQASNERTAILEQSRIMQAEAVAKLQKLVGTQGRGEELLAIAAKELGRLQVSETKLSDSKEIDRISEALDSITRVVNYLSEMAELKKIEEEIPRITLVAEDIQKRVDKLTSLKASLDSIREILRAYLEESVGELLGSLEDTINNYYSTICGHPYFVKIKLEPDAKKPLIYNVRGVTEDETLSTYIPTRFSSAQMNVVGISLFLAHAEKMLTQLATLIMDDPTQSFDESHKRDLVKVIKELSESRQILIATQDESFSEAIRDSCGTRVAEWNFTEWTEEGPVVAPA